MQAAWFEKFGAARDVLVVGEKPAPVAGPGEVLVRLRTSGVIATYSSTQVKEPRLPFFRMMYLDLTVHFVIVYSMPEPAKKQAIADITQAFRHGMLQHRIADRVPLAEIARASELVEQGGSNGCVVVEVD